MANVLLVEDQPLIFTIIRAFFGGTQHVVRAVETGTAAVMAVLSEKPDVIITDLQLPDMKGLELLQIMHDEYHIPVVVMSGPSIADEEDEISTALKMGACAALLKPVSREQVLSTVHRVLAGSYAGSAAS